MFESPLIQCSPLLFLGFGAVLCDAGRTYDQRVDIGAAWIHGPDGNPLWEFAQRHLKSITTAKTDDQSTTLFSMESGQGKNRIAPMSGEVLMNAFLKFQSLLDAVGEYVKSSSSTTHPDQLAETHNGLIDSLTENKSCPSSAPAKAITRETLERALEHVYQSDPKFKLASVQEKQAINYLISSTESLQNASASCLLFHCVSPLIIVHVQG